MLFCFFFCSVDVRHCSSSQALRWDVQMPSGPEHSQWHIFQQFLRVVSFQAAPASSRDNKRNASAKLLRPNGKERKLEIIKFIQSANRKRRRPEIVRSLSRTFHSTDASPLNDRSVSS